jgi:hypothetical protein
VLQAHSPEASLTERPTDLKCLLDTRELWAQFSGGAEVLKAETVQFPIAFHAFHTENPTFVTSMVDHPEEGELVLADLNRDAGLIQFKSAAWLDTQFGGLLFGEDARPLRLVARESNIEYFFSIGADGKFRSTLEQTVSDKGQWRSIVLSGTCQHKPVAVKPDARAANQCKDGDIKACLDEGARVEKSNRVAALDLYLKGCAKGAEKADAARAIAADACDAAARVVAVLGDKVRAESLVKQAAHLRGRK